MSFLEKSIPGFCGLAATQISRLLFLLLEVHQPSALGLAPYSANPQGHLPPHLKLVASHTPTAFLRPGQPGDRG